MSIYKPSFEAFYLENYKKVYSYIRKRVCVTESAEDLTQNVFEYCYRSYDSFDPEKSSISTWLYLIVNSRLKNYYRDEKHSEDIELYENLLSAKDSDMDKAIYLEQLKKAILYALESLPERQRKVIVYKYFADMSHAEIAEMIGTSETNSRVMLTRALNKMKECLQDFAD